MAFVSKKQRLARRKNFNVFRIRGCIKNLENILYSDDILGEDYDRLRGALINLKGMSFAREKSD